MSSKNVEEYLDGIIAEQKRIGDIMEQETSLVAQEIDDLFVQASTKDASFALSKGIITDIRPINIPQGATVIQLIF